MQQKDYYSYSVHSASAFVRAAQMRLLTSFRRGGNRPSLWRWQDCISIEGDMTWRYGTKDNQGRQETI